MKNIQSKSYIQAQSQTVTFNPQMMKNPQQQQQNDPKIKNFQQAFANLGLPGMSTFSEADAMTLNQIQTEIRKKLRMVGFTRLGF